MASKDEQVRATIAEQASEWFVVNDEAPLGTQDSAALVAWLKTSPVHVEEFLGVAAIARDLHAAGTEPEFALENLLARARAEDERPVQSAWSGNIAAIGVAPVRRWQTAAAVGVAFLGVLLWWSFKPTARVSAPAAAVSLHFETRHGEQHTFRLADNSVLHLNTDSAVTLQYSPTQRLAMLTAGEANFEVAHDPKRVFRVRAGAAEVVDLGTRFDVRLKPDSTVVTVVAGRVSVERSAMSDQRGTGSSRNESPRSVVLGANQQISVAEGHWPSIPIAVDAERATAWLHRQIVFEHEPLHFVAAEFNRYTSKPIEITAPELRNLEVSGTFSTDDPEEFLAFLRSLEGVRVEVTATRIRVSQK